MEMCAWIDMNEMSMQNFIAFIWLHQLERFMCLSYRKLHRIIVKKIIYPWPTHSKFQFFYMKNLE